MTYIYSGKEVIQKINNLFIMKKKISELIKELESCLKEEGDLNVIVRDYADGNDYPVSNLKVCNSIEFGCKICLIE